VRSEPPSREGDRNRARLHLSNVGGSAGDPRRINRSHIEKAKETLIDQPALPGGRVGGLHRTQFGRADTGKPRENPLSFSLPFFPRSSQLLRSSKRTADAGCSAEEREIQTSPVRSVVTYAVALH
jgi:hypothetical protein